MSLRAQQSRRMILIAVLAVLLASCASTADSPAGGSPSATPSAGGSSSSTSAGATTLTGVIIEGIRSTCRVLDTGQRRYALVGPGVHSLREGDRVRAVGQARPELVNACGTTFSVAEVQVL